MKSALKQSRPRRQGSALILSLMFIVIFSALAAAMAGMSGANVQIADNHRKADSARGAAESGVEAVRYWMSHIVLPGTILPEQRFSYLTANLQAVLSDSGITPTTTGTTISIPTLPLTPCHNQDFSAVLTQISNEIVQVDVTGRYRSAERTIRSNFVYGIRAHNVFDYGLASKGSMYLSGSFETLPGDPKLKVEANAFILSEDSAVALTMEGRSMIGGTVTLTDSTKIVNIGTRAGIGGLRGDAALANVAIEDTYCEFPEMYPAPFYAYATNVVSATTISGGTWDNVRVPAGLNPTFNGANMRGVVYIESPNIVTFAGGSTITGIIVTNGDPEYDPDPADPTAPTIIFGANTNSFSTALLPYEPQFAGLQGQTGTAVLAPGFRVEFTGTFGIFNGAIGANGIEVSGGSGGTINGSIINYSSYPMVLGGNGNLTFNRSGLVEVPAGFAPQLVMYYDSSSYSEVSL